MKIYHHILLFMSIITLSANEEFSYVPCVRQPNEEREATRHLIRAIHLNNQEKFIAVIDHANINEPDALGETPIFLALALQRTNFVYRLLQKGALVRQANYMGDTLLHRAVRGRDRDLVKQLLASGADIYAVNKYGTSPLSYVLRNRVRLFIDIFEEHCFKPAHVELPMPYNPYDYEETTTLFIGPALPEAADDPIYYPEIVYQHE